MHAGAALGRSLISTSPSERDRRTGFRATIAVLHSGPGPPHGCTNSALSHPPPSPGEVHSEMTATLSGQSSATTTRSHGNGREPNGALDSSPRRCRTSCNGASRARSASTAVSRMLYSTDASNYQIDPVGVVIPASARRRPGHHRARRPATGPAPAARRRLVARRANRRRGAGHRLLQGAVDRVLEIDLEGGSVTVEPGINHRRPQSPAQAERADVRPRSRLRQSRHRRRRRRQQLDRRRTRSSTA